MCRNNVCRFVVPWLDDSLDPPAVMLLVVRALVGEIRRIRQLT